jgi:hypothetical protein
MAVSSRPTPMRLHAMAEAKDAEIPVLRGSWLPSGAAEAELRLAESSDACRWTALIRVRRRRRRRGGHGVCALIERPFIIVFVRTAATVCSTEEVGRSVS